MYLLKLGLESQPCFEFCFDYLLPDISPGQVSFIYSPAGLVNINYPAALVLELLLLLTATWWQGYACPTLGLRATRALIKGSPVPGL